jgi:heat shock protein HtpX
MNTLKTGLLLAAMGAAAVGIGAYFFGTNGAVIGLVIAFAMQAISFFGGHKIALSYAKAVPLQRQQLPWLWDANVQLSERAGIPAPTLYLSPDPQPNAFAAGRNPKVAVVCFNQGLIQAMRQDEVIAVLAHEIAHVKNRDSLIMTVTAAFASFITFLAHMAFFLRSGDDDRNPLVDLLFMLLAPIAATVVQLAISRTREFAADRTAAELMGDPGPMMRALESLERGTHAIPSRTAEPATAHMYIASPLSGAGFSKLFSTHPPIKDRVAALAQLRGQRVA